MVTATMAMECSTSSISSLPPQFRLRSFNRSSPSLSFPSSRPCLSASSPSFGRFIRPQSSPFTRASLPLPSPGSLGFNPLHTLPDANRFSSASKNSHLQPLPPVFKAYSAASSDGVPSDIPSASDQSLEAKEKSDTGGTLLLACFFGLWYLFNIYFNIYNKQVLKVFQYPVTVTQFQFFIGAIISVSMWSVGLHKRPEINTSQILAILPLACVHTMGNLFTNMSLGKVAVSFTHTIKAMEPFFSVLLSALVLGEYPSLLVVASLLPIVGGVALASLTEASFNWAGFLSAMASNVTFQSRNVLSKKLMVKKEKSMDNINLFSIITILSFFLLAPVTLLLEGVKFTPTYLQSAGLDVKVLAIRALLAAVCFHAYQQVSYMILQRVSPVTHSVGNCVKRVVVIVTSVLFFRTPVSLINGIGTGIALGGVFAYSRVKQIKKKPE